MEERATGKVRGRKKQNTYPLRCPLSRSRGMVPFRFRCVPRPVQSRTHYLVLAAGALPARSSYTAENRGVAVFLIVEGGELYDPKPRGVNSVMIVNDRIEKIGAIDRSALDALG